MLKLASLTTGASYVKAASAVNAAFGTNKTLSEGSLKNAGTFLLRGAQNAAHASNTTILRGSTLTLTPVTPV